MDDPDDEVLPASRRRRRSAALLGCATVLVLLALLGWFVATHTETTDRRSLFGAAPLPAHPQAVPIT